VKSYYYESKDEIDYCTEDMARDISVYYLVLLLFRKAIIDVAFIPTHVSANYPISTMDDICRNAID